MLCTGYDFLADLVYHWACLPRKHTMLYCTCRLQEDKSIMYKDIANELLSFIQKSPSCFHAGELIGMVAQQVGGKGGGRPDMAQAGGTDAAALPAALASVKGWVSAKLQ